MIQSPIMQPIMIASRRRRVLIMESRLLIPGIVSRCELSPGGGKAEVIYALRTPVIRVWIPVSVVR